MTHRLLSIAISAAVVLAGLGAGAAPQSSPAADKLLASARHKAVDDGDVPGAIEMYRRIVSGAGADRTLAARALLGLAECYEMTGRPEARDTLQTVVTKYSDVVAAAAPARAKLAALDQARDTLVVQKLAWDHKGWAVSPDGRYLTYTDDQSGDLWKQELPSGQGRRLTREGAGFDVKGRYASDAFPSPDSKSIAYGWFATGRPYEIRLISRDGGTPKVVYTAKTPGHAVDPMGWLPDGKSILATEGADAFFGPRDLIVITVADGSARVIKHFEKGASSLSSFRLSPDARFAAYELFASGAQRDVFLLDLQSGRELELLKHPANDQFLGWFPGGDRILFASDRGGAMGIWAAAVTDGVIRDDPWLVRRDTGTIVGYGFTRTGDFYYRVANREEEVYFADLGPAGAQSPKRLSRIESRFTGSKSQAAWSASGDRIAYVQSPTTAPVVLTGPIRDGQMSFVAMAPSVTTTQTLAIKAMSTGGIENRAVALQAMQHPAWLPDGSAVVVQGRDLESRQGLHLVTAATGAVTPLAIQSARTDNTRRFEPVATRDGRIFFRWSTGKEGGISVVRQGSAAEEAIVKELVQSFGVSPDGRWVAFARRASGAGSPMNIYLVSAAGGTPKQIGTPVEYGTASGYPPIAWSTDSASVFVVKQVNRAEQLWRFPVNGDEPQDTGIAWTGTIGRLSVHPDGKRLAISTSGVASETWVLKNLSAAKGR